MDFRFFHRRELRRAAVGVVCSLALIAAVMPAYGRQSSSSNSSAKKSTAQKTTAKSLPKKHGTTATPATMRMASSKKPRRRKNSTRFEGSKKLDKKPRQPIKKPWIGENTLQGAPPERGKV